MAFDATKPASSTSLRASNPQILANWVALQAALDNEHIFTGTASGTQTGDHSQGSARCFSQSGAPATRVDGNGFLSTDLGSIWVDTDDNAIYVLTATVPTWTPVSTEIIATLLASPRVFGSTLGVTGDFTVNDEFTVLANGNTTILGTLLVSTTNIAGTLDVDDTLDVAGVTTLAGGLAAVTMTGELNAGDNQIAGLAAGTNSTDAVRLGQWAPPNLTTENYTALPNDIMVKWGSGTATVSNPIITFDSTIAFAAAPLVFTQITGTNPPTNENISVNTVTTINFKADASNGSISFDYFAIGRR